MFFLLLIIFNQNIQIWGGENVEISLRMWMCGGEMEIVPCSKVGHVYKQKNVYTYPKGNLQVQEPSKIDVTHLGGGGEICQKVMLLHKPIQ